MTQRTATGCQEILTQLADDLQLDDTTAVRKAGYFVGINAYATDNFMLFDDSIRFVYVPWRNCSQSGQYHFRQIRNGKDTQIFPQHHARAETTTGDARPAL